MEGGRCEDSRGRWEAGVGRELKGGERQMWELRSLI